MNFMKLWKERGNVPAKKIFPMDQVEVTVYGVLQSAATETSESSEPFVKLLTKDQKCHLNIFADPFVCLSIERYQIGVQSPRPLNYDFMVDIVRSLNATVRAARIVSLHNGTYYAILELTDQNKRTHQIDCRPSDAILLALHSQAPIFVASDLLVKSGFVIEYNAPNRWKTEKS